MCTLLHTHTLGWFPYIYILGSLKLMRHFSVFLKAFYLYQDQRSINDKSPFFDDLLLLFNYIHNSSFIQTFSLQNRGAFLRSRSPDVLVEHCIRQLYDTFLKLEACSSLYRSKQQNNVRRHSLIFHLLFVKFPKFNQIAQLLE